MPGTQPIPPVFLAGNFLSSVAGSRSPLEDLADKLRSAGVDPVCASHFRPGWLRALHMLSTAFIQRSRYRVSVVDLYSGRAFLWGEAMTIALQQMGCPFVLMLHGGGLPRFAEKRARRVSACLKRANVVGAPSPYLADAMQPYHPNIRILPNPIDLRSFPMRLSKTVRPDLIWVRAFHRIYNPELAPRVLSLLTAEFPEIRLTMVGRDKGDGSLERTCEIAARTRTDSRIEFAGGIPRADVPTWLARSDIFLNTTDVDNTPVSVIEAMACGLCIVSTDVGGIPKLLQHERDSLLVPPDDPEAMAAAVRRILTEPGLAEALSRNARRKAEQFDWSVLLPQWRDLLVKLDVRTPS